MRKKLVSLLLILIFVAQSLPLGGAGGDGKSGTDGGGSHQLDCPDRPFEGCGGVSSGNGCQLKHECAADV